LAFGSRAPRRESVVDAAEREHQRADIGVVEKVHAVDLDGIAHRPVAARLDQRSPDVCGAAQAPL
jgi:hypothetical protein